MTINRRDFVGGLAAAFAFGCPGWQAARAAGLAQGVRRLRFGVLSDVHIYSAADVPYFTLARDYVPAVLDGVAGMYDRQNKTFTASAGTGAFQYGAVTNVAGYVRTTLCASPSAEMIGSGFLFIVK